LLEKTKANISYHDPYISEIEISGKKYHSTPLKEIKKYDCVLIITNHSCIDYEKIAKEAKLILDTRNAIKSKSDKIYKL